MLSYEIPAFRYVLDFLNYHIAIHHSEDFLAIINLFNNILLQIDLDYNIVIIVVFFIATSNFSNLCIFTDLIPDFPLFYFMHTINLNYSFIYFEFRCCSSKQVFTIESSYKVSFIDFEKVILVITDKTNCFDHNIPFLMVKTVTACIKH